MTNQVPNQDYNIEQLLEMQQNYRTAPTASAGSGGGGGSGAHMMPHLLHPRSPLSGVFHAPPQPLFHHHHHHHHQQPLLGLSLDQAQPHCAAGGPSFFKLDPLSSSTPNSNYVFHGQPVPSPVPMAPHQPAVRPRVRARRGQATDPHSIAERLRRERIAERIRALQELVPSVNKTDKAVMLDEIVDYVKFLRLQVKVLSMSRLGGAGAVVPLVTDTPISSVEEEVGEGGQGHPVWEKWSNDGTEGQVAKLMEENVGAAMQFLQSKALCIMPISLASAMYHSQPQDACSLIKPESNPPS